MHDLSLKGIARRYRGASGDITVAGDIFGMSPISGDQSLRSKLAQLSTEEHDYSMKECIYGWDATYRQTWTHIVLRVCLNPEAGISTATMNTARTRWENGVETIWNGKWAGGRSGELPCRFSFDLQWVTSSPHHTVRVRAGSGGTNMTLWHTVDSGGVAAHEVGHMLGHEDEYASATCPARSPVNTGNVMDNNSNNVPARLMQGFADNVGTGVVAFFQ